VVSYLDILAETEKFESTTPIDKLFIFQVIFGGFWRKLHEVTFWETLTFIDDPPQYNLLTMSLPLFYMIPRGGWLSHPN